MDKRLCSICAKYETRLGWEGEQIELVIESVGPVCPKCFSEYRMIVSKWKQFQQIYDIEAEGSDAILTEQNRKNALRKHFICQYCGSIQNIMLICYDYWPPREVKRLIWKNYGPMCRDCYDKITKVVEECKKRQLVYDIEGRIARDYAFLNEPETDRHG